MGLSSSKRLPKEDLQFLIQNTNFTKQQIKAWYSGFMKDCPDGQLSRAKFLEVYSSFFPQGNAEKFCEHVFRTFDSDNSGRIDFKEFLLAINITSAGQPEQKLEWAFQMYDVNGDGTIDPSEMAEIIGAIYNMVGNSICDGDPCDSPEKRTAEIFAKMDTNGDGVLSKDEFVRGCMTDEFLCQMLTSTGGGQPATEQPPAGAV
jgi:neurocalcin delta